MKKMLFLIFALALKNLIFAQAPTPSENALLWKITGNGLKAPAYLYGTIHVIPRKDFFVTDSTRMALMQSSKIAFEIDLKKELRLIPQLRLLSKMRMKGDTTLAMLLSPEDYRLVRNRFDSKRLPARMLERVKPFFLSELLGQSDPKNARTEMTSYEMEFLDLAKSQGKKTTGLETGAFQMSVFDKIPYQAQAEMLVQELKNKDKSSKEYNQLVKIYRKQDLEMLSQMMFTNSGEDLNSFNNILLDQRNNNWIPVMEKLMRKQKMFFAVGAAHLLGEQGVVALLRKKGYTLTAIK